MSCIVETEHGELSQMENMEIGGNDVLGIEVNESVPTPTVRTAKRNAGSRCPTWQTRDCCRGLQENDLWIYQHQFEGSVPSLKAEDLLAQ